MDNMAEKQEGDFKPNIPPSLASGRYDPETLEIDYAAEKKLVRKLDLHIVPMVMLLYLLVRWQGPPYPGFHALIWLSDGLHLSDADFLMLNWHSHFSIESTSVTRASMASLRI